MDTVTKCIPDNAVCGPTGTPITFPNNMWHDMGRLADLVKERFGRDCKPEHGKDGDKLTYLVSTDLLSERALTVPERAAIEALAWYCREYGGGLKRDVTVTFPKIIHDRSDADSIVDAEPLSFGDEARAYMFAEVVECCFSVDAHVIETPAGWAVTVSNQWRGLDAEELAHLQGACRVLMHFTVEAGDGAYASQSPDQKHHTPDPEARIAWHTRKNAPLEHIESALGEILSRLGQNAATGAETPSAAARGTRGRGLEALIPSAGKAGKSPAKQMA